RPARGDEGCRGGRMAPPAARLLPHRSRAGRLRGRLARRRRGRQVAAVPARDNSGMPDSVRLALSQLNLTVGDIAGNEAKIRRDLDRAREAGAQIVLFPELAVTGYPPEDL